MLSHAVDTHAQLKKPKDREWIHILLSYLKTYVEELGNELLMHEDDKAAYVGRLIDEMRSAAEGLETGRIIHTFLLACRLNYHF